MERYYDNAINHCISGPDYIVGYIGSVIRNYLMDNDTVHWQDLRLASSAHNETGFTALPGGRRGGLFAGIGYQGCWWANGPTDNGEFSHIVMPWRALDSYGKDIWRDWGLTYSSNSVRCTKPFVP